MADHNQDCGWKAGVCPHGIVFDEPGSPELDAARRRTASELAIARGTMIMAGRALDELGAVVAGAEHREAERAKRWAVQWMTGSYSGLLG